MQKTTSKNILATFAALVLLFLFPFVSCEKGNPDNSGTGIRRISKTIRSLATIPIPGRY